MGACPSKIFWVGLSARDRLHDCQEVHNYGSETYRLDMDTVVGYGSAYGYNLHLC